MRSLVMAAFVLWSQQVAFANPWENPLHKKIGHLSCRVQKPCRLKDKIGFCLNNFRIYGPYKGRIKLDGELSVSPFNLGTLDYSFEQSNGYRLKKGKNSSINLKAGWNNGTVLMNLQTHDRIRWHGLFRHSKGASFKVFCLRNAIKRPLISFPELD